jgi:hypothetical protein
VLAYIVNTAGETMVGERLGYQAAELYLGSVSAPIAGDGTISGIAPSCSSVAGSANIVSTLASV